MSIQHAILGLLSWKPATGYELKKIFEQSPTMYWSGNNNQIYKSLVKLLDEGLVTNEVQHQTGSPSKKIYSITEEGRACLKEWVVSESEVPELRNTFLIQLAWADQLSDEELDELLEQYESKIGTQLLYQQEKRRRGASAPGRSERETFLWEQISENALLFYRNELVWVQQIRKQLGERKQKEEKAAMNYTIVDHGGSKYIEVLAAEPRLGTEQDAVDLVAVCMEHESRYILLHSEALSEDFFKLRTGVAGHMIQKWINYRVKAAAVAPKALIHQGRFKEMALEANKSHHFGVFESREDAESWLLKE